jgi:hypothetical protein
MMFLPLLRCSLVCLATALVWGVANPVAAAAPADTGAPLKVSVSNVAAESIGSAPVTFGQPFRQGDFPQDVRLSSSGDSLPAQVDVKRRYADGSLRFAVISATLDELAPQETLPIELTPADAAVDAPTVRYFPSDLLKRGFEALVTFRFPDGAVRIVSARKLLEREGPQARTWLQGPVATEWLLVGVPEDERGKADEDLCVRFQVRAYHGGESARVSVVVENCWDTWAGNIRYDVTVSVGGREVFRRAAVDHRPLSRWRTVVWWGREAPPVHVAHDLGYLAATGGLPNYDRNLPAPPRSRREDDLVREGPPWDLLGRGPLTAYMPTTGGRPEIGPYPLWMVRFLLTMEPRWRDFVLAAGDLAGSWPIHVRARATDRIMTIDERPDFWLDERGQDRPRWKPPRQQPDAQQDRLTPDLAHQPSLAYVPYLVTGDHYYLEEAYFWANYCLLASWPHPREKSRGLLADQIRGDAWALRNLGDAAWVATDGDPEQTYFEEKVRHNLAHRIAVMYGPPEFNRIGAWGLRTVEDARIQNPANPRWIITAPWEEDYLLWSLHHLFELGWHEAARPRDFLLRRRVGTLLHAPDFDPHLATPYRMVVGEKGPDGRPVVYDDWKVLGRENARLSKPDVPNYGNSYAYSARAALVCGVDAGFPGAREALSVLEGMLPGNRDVMAREPFWALAPRSAEHPRQKPRAVSGLEDHGRP